MLHQFFGTNEAYTRDMWGCSLSFVPCLWCASSRSPFPQSKCQNISKHSTKNWIICEFLLMHALSSLQTFMYHCPLCSLVSLANSEKTPRSPSIPWPSAHTNIKCHESCHESLWEKCICNHLHRFFILCFMPGRYAVRPGHRRIFRS